MKNNVCQVKYIVNISLFKGSLLRIDFYPKIHSDNKYRMLTNQFKFGRLGGTLLNIMQDVINKTSCDTVSFPKIRTV